MKFFALYFLVSAPFFYANAFGYFRDRPTKTSIYDCKIACGLRAPYSNPETEKMHLGQHGEPLMQKTSEMFTVDSNSAEPTHVPLSSQGELSFSVTVRVGEAIHHQQSTFFANDAPYLMTPESEAMLFVVTPHVSGKMPINPDLVVVQKARKGQNFIYGSTAVDGEFLNFECQPK